MEKTRKRKWRVFVVHSPGYRALLLLASFSLAVENIIYFSERGRPHGSLANLRKEGERRRFERKRDLNILSGGSTSP